MHPRLYLSLVFFLFVHRATGQLIKKNESDRINDLLQKIATENRPDTYLIKNATILTMREPDVLLNHDVLVENGTITKIGKDLSAPANSKTIDATGKFVMPGLVDMHAHLFLQNPMTNTWILHLLVNGVTTIRDMNGSPDKLVFRDKIARNEILAPNIYQASPLADSRKDKFLVQITTPDDARRFVQEAKKSGYDFIKVYDGIKPAVYDALLEESHKLGLEAVGHVPDEVTVDRALLQGQHSIEHLTGYFEWRGPVVERSAIADVGRLTANSQTWNCPTIYNHFLNGARDEATRILSDPVAKMIPESLRKIWAKRLSDNSKEMVDIVDKHGPENFNVLKNLLTELYNADAKLLVGTDAGNLPFLIPGYSLHKEMELMATIGIPNDELLEMATYSAALALGKDQQFGTIEVGRRADMLILNANPIQDLKTLQDPEGIMVRGIWISKEKRSAIVNEMTSIFNN